MRLLFILVGIIINLAKAQKIFTMNGLILEYVYVAELVDAHP